MQSGSTSCHYSAFISYSHHDVRHALKLQRRIERYRLPRQLRKSDGQSSSGRLKPVFRDRDELTAAADLTAAVREALATSEYLIVVCTPSSAASSWVGREIALFRTIRGPDAVLTALFDGDAGTAFNPELLTGSEGAATQPLAADFRTGGDGRLALLKLVAVLAGVRLDELVRRDAQRRFRQLAGLLGAVLVFAALIAGIVVVALHERAQARAEQQRGIATIEQLAAQREAISQAGNLDLLRAYDRTALNFFDGRDIRALPPAAQLLSAKLLQGGAEDDEAAGDLAGLKAAASGAWQTTDRLLAADGNATDRIFAHAQSEYWLGLAAWRLGDLAAAQRHFSAYSALAGRLVALAPGKPDWLKEAGDADSNLATYYLRQSMDLQRAAALYRRAQGRFEQAARRGYDSEIWDDLADGYGWLADIARLGGDYDTAFRYRMSQRRALEVMGAHEPDNAKIETALIKNQLGLARVLAGQQQWSEALAGFDSGRRQAQARLRRDRSNADMALQARAFDLFEVQTWLAMPDAIRPSADRIAATLRNCAPERAKSPSGEGFVFCSILQERLKRQQGASTGNDPIARNLCLQSDVRGLSERWRLDLRTETAFLQCQNRGVQ